eukprot:m.492092 g.492092  ORF g.492092 m.492092 type:complete len:425 (+) comp31589_c0_seq1:102-1376(+)
MASHGRLAFSLARLGISSAEAPRPAKVFLSHATGFCKEVYRPVVSRLDALASKHGVSLLCVSVDLRGHGDSPKLGITPPPPKCNVAARFGPELFATDFANVIAHVDAQFCSDPVFGSHALHGAEGGGSGAGGGDGDGGASNGTTSGRDPVLAVPWVGAGHSYGATGLIQAELMWPGLFRDLVLFEPILYPSRAALVELRESVVLGNLVSLALDSPMARFHRLTNMALKRRGTWPSMAQAVEYFHSRPLFAGFHPDVLQGYLDGALEHVNEGSVHANPSNSSEGDTEGDAGDISSSGDSGGDTRSTASAADDGPVRLKCLPHEEASVYASTGMRIFDRLPSVQSRGVVAFGANSNQMDTIAGSTRRMYDAVAQQLPGCPDKALVLGNSHFSPLEDPDTFADLIFEHVLHAVSSFSNTPQKHPSKL